jgi:hypothetical protein
VQILLDCEVDLADVRDELRRRLGVPSLPRGHLSGLTSATGETIQDFCCVAEGATGPPLLLRITPGSDQKSARRPGGSLTLTPGAQ